MQNEESAWLSWEGNMQTFGELCTAYSIYSEEQARIDALAGVAPGTTARMVIGRYPVSRVDASRVIEAFCGYVRQAGWALDNVEIHIGVFCHELQFMSSEAAIL